MWQMIPVDVIAHPLKDGSDKVCQTPRFWNVYSKHYQSSRQKTSNRSIVKWVVNVPQWNLCILPCLSSSLKENMSGKFEEGYAEATTSVTSDVIFIDPSLLHKQSWWLRCHGVFKQFAWSAIAFPKGENYSRLPPCIIIFLRRPCGHCRIPELLHQRNCGLISNGSTAFKLVNSKQRH